MTFHVRDRRVLGVGSLRRYGPCRPVIGIPAGDPAPAWRCSTPAIHSFDNGALKICVYADDHAPPHVHMLRNDVDSLIRIADLRVMQGEIDRRDYARVCAWIAGNLGAVEAKWRELDERG